MEVGDVEGKAGFKETRRAEEGFAFVVAEELPVAEVGFGELAGPGFDIS